MSTESQSLSISVEREVLRNERRHTMNEQEWLEQRRRVVTATDVPILLGVSQYKSPLQLWAEKVEGEEQAQSTAMEVGLDLQPVLVRKAGKLTGWSARELPLEEAWHVKGITRTHCESALCRACLHLGATLDGKIVVPDDREKRAYGLGVMGYDDDVAPGEYILECKTTGKLEDDEKLPASWFAQVQTQMYVHDIPGAVVIALIMDYNRRYMMWFVPYDDGFVRSVVLPAANEFYQHLVDQTPPAVTSAADLPFVKRKYKGGDDVLDTDEYDELLSEYARLQEKLAEIREKEKSIQDEMHSIEAKLWQVAGEQSAAQIVSSRYVVTFRITHRKEYVVPEQDIKQLRIKEVKQ